jgi:hypothetical protein
MTDMPMQGFQKPSDVKLPDLKKWPSLQQLIGRLLVVRPIEIGQLKDMSSEAAIAAGKMKDVIFCDVTFLTGSPIAVVLDKMQQVTQQLDPPVSVGMTMDRYIIGQAWFMRRLKDKVGEPGYPGLLGVLGTQKFGTNVGWVLLEPSDEHLALAGKWQVHAARQRSAAVAASNPMVVSAPAPAPAPAPAEPWSPPVAAPIADPWAEQAAAPVAPAAVAEEKPPWAS